MSLAVERHGADDFGVNTLTAPSVGQREQRFVRYTIQCNTTCNTMQYKVFNVQ